MTAALPLGQNLDSPEVGEEADREKGQNVSAGSQDRLTVVGGALRLGQEEHTWTSCVPAAGYRWHRH